MDKNSVLCQLMGLHVNDMLNQIVETDANYQEIVRKSGKCSDLLDALGLSKKA